MVTSQSSEVLAIAPSPGVASSRRMLEPQRGTIQSGASRSVSPAILRTETRLWDCRKRGSVADSWYLSANMGEGSVRKVCNAHLDSGGVGGGVRAVRGMVNFKDGCKPVGGGNAAVNTHESGSG